MSNIRQIKVGDHAVVVSGSCCGGHPAGAIVEIVDVYDAMPERTLFHCAPIKNSSFTCWLWGCDNCLILLEEPEDDGQES
jgi:hypothetical protein